MRFFKYIKNLTIYFFIVFSCFSFIRSFEGSLIASPFLRINYLERHKPFQQIIKQKQISGYVESGYYPSYYGEDYYPYYGEDYYPYYGEDNNYDTYTAPDPIVKDPDLVDAINETRKQMEENNKEKQVSNQLKQERNAIQKEISEELRRNNNREDYLLYEEMQRQERLKEVEKFEKKKYFTEVQPAPSW